MKIVIHRQEQSVFFSVFDPAEDLPNGVVGYTTPGMLVRMRFMFSNLTHEQRLLLDVDEHGLLSYKLWTPGDYHVKPKKHCLVMDHSMTFNENRIHHLETH